MTALALALPRNRPGDQIGPDQAHAQAERFLTEAGARLRHPGLQAVQRVRVAHIDAAGLSSSTARREPILTESGDMLFFDGRLDNRHRLPGSPGPGSELTDAQLALELLRRDGENALRTFVGPFALFAFLADRQTALLARDVIGGRSLFYRLTPDWLIVASEPSAILAHPAVGKQLNSGMLAAYFAVGGDLPAGQTFFSEVAELRPGHVLSIRPDGCEERRFRTIRVARGGLQSDADAIHCFRDALREAVGCRLPEQGAPAVLMSGGLDSTSVAAMAVDQAGDREVFATSWIFDETPASNERAYIEPVVGKLGLKPLDIDGDALWPLGDFAHWPHNPNVPLANLYARLVRASLAAARGVGCTVILNGEFGDHLFGNAAYWLRDLLSEGRWKEAATEVWRECRNNPRRLRAPLAIALLGRAHGARLAMPSPSWMTPAAANLLGDRPAAPAGCRSPRQWQIACSPTNALSHTASNRLYGEFGIEPRRPYRDVRLIELALQLPAHLFYRPGRSKLLLRDAMRGMLPEKTRLREWQSSLLPLAARGLFDKEHDVVQELLWSGQRRWPAFVREEWVRDALPRLKAGAPDGAPWAVIWRILTYEIWRNCEPYADGSISQEAGPCAVGPRGSG